MLWYTKSKQTIKERQQKQQHIKKQKDNKSREFTFNRANAIEWECVKYVWASHAIQHLVELTLKKEKNNNHKRKMKKKKNE